MLVISTNNAWKILIVQLNPWVAMHGCVRAYTQRCDVMNFAFACFVIECHFVLFWDVDYVGQNVK